MIAPDVYAMLETRLSTWLAEALALAERGPEIVRSLVALVAPRVSSAEGAPRAEVRFVPELDTAALGWDEHARRFVIGIGADMLQRDLTGPADLLYLVCHEALHLVRGEHGLPPGRLALATNLAADALNDAWLTGPALEGFFAPTDALPARRSVSSPANALLVPLPAAAAYLEEHEAPLAPRVSRAFFERVVVAPERGAVAYDARAWAEVHHALQIGGRGDTLGLDLATRLVLPLLDQLPEPPRAREPLPSAACDALAALRRRLARGRASASPGHGPRGALTTTEVTLASPSRRLERFLRGLARAATGGPPAWSAEGPCVRTGGEGARWSRRSLVEWRSGLRGLPFTTSEPLGGEAPAGLALYLDASVSMASELPVILGTVARRCADVLALPVRAFSVGVFDVTPRELARGRLRTEGGTDFTPLVDDLLRRRVRHAVIVTDGEAPSLPRAGVDALRARGVRIALVFPGEADTRSPLDPLCPTSARGARLGLRLGAFASFGRLP